jgi:hypothetical protein
MSGEDMIKMANDIVEKKSLTEAEATHIIGASILGTGYFHSLEIAKTPPEEIAAAKRIVSAALTRQGEAVKRSLRPMTPEEREQSLVPVVTPEGLYYYLQGKIFADEGVKKDPDDPAARLRVHQELIDQTRKLMDEHPESAGVIHQVLRGVFLSNPMMDKAPPPKAAPLPKGVVQA